MSQLNLKPTHVAVKNYHAALHHFGQLHIDHEMAVRSAFQSLLSSCGRKLKLKLTLVPEFEIKRAHSAIRVDGALLDEFHLAHGYWEAKDEKDDLDREIKAKLDKGYPRDNIIFQAPERAVLYQSGTRIRDEDISKPDKLVQIVNQFFDYKAPHIEEWEQAVTEFSERIPELAAAVKKIIDEERRHSPSFVRSFEDFYARLPSSHQSQSLRRCGRAHVDPAPADGAHLRENLRQPRFHPPQRSSRRDRKSHSRTDQAVLQPKRIPTPARPASTKPSKSAPKTPPASLKSKPS